MTILNLEIIKLLLYDHSRITTIAILFYFVEHTDFLNTRYLSFFLTKAKNHALDHVANMFFVVIMANIVIQ